MSPQSEKRLEANSCGLVHAVPSPFVSAGNADKMLAILDSDAADADDRLLSALESGGGTALRNALVTNLRNTVETLDAAGLGNPDQ